MIKRTFKREIITKALDRCFISIDKKNTMPILNNILLETHDNYCTLISTNLDSSVIASVVPEEGEGEGKYAFPAKYVYDICKLARGETIDFIFDNDQQVLNIRAERSRYTIPCADPSDFPAVDDFSGKDGKVIHISRMISIYKKLQFSMTENNMNKVYSGVLINPSPEKGSVEMVTTDIHRLSVTSLKNFDFSIKGAEEGIVVSGKNFSEIQKIFSNITEAEMSVEEGKLFIKGDNVVFVARLLKNEFPNYKGIVGSEKDILEKDKCVINKKSLVEAIKRVTALSVDEKIWTTKFEFTGNVLVMNSQTSFGGNSEDEILVDTPFETEKSIGINSRYLTEVLNVMDSESVTIVVEEGLKPLTLVESYEDFSYVHLIMPLRI